MTDTLAVQGNTVPGVMAILLAAGYSSRMGAFKPLLPLGDDPPTVLEIVASSYRKADVARCLVVTGYNAEALYPEAARLGLVAVHNPHFDEGMFSSICAGLAAVGDFSGHVFVQPVDIPLVRPDTLKRLAAAARDVEQPVLVPEFCGKSGHPVVLRTDILPHIVQWRGEGGLRKALEQFSVCRVPVADSGILHDMDTPQAHALTCERFARLHIPTPQEAECMLRLYAGVPDRGIAHGRAVARVALALADSLAHVPGACVPGLDMGLIEAAALLHDIAKGPGGTKGHEQAGRRLLESWGFFEAGRIVGAHRDCVLAPGSVITETEIVYIADKLARGPFRVDISTRFDEKIARYQGDLPAVAAICRRKNNALRLAAHLEALLGRSLAELLEAAGLPSGKNISG